MRSNCPNCNNKSSRKHCGHKGCKWYMCECERTLKIQYLVFDNKGRVFLQMK